MTQKISDVMTPSARSIDLRASVEEAARIMCDEGIGDVIVTDGEQVCGIVTDRDIVVRAVAQGQPTTLPVSEICSGDVQCLSPDASVDEAVEMMRQHAIRRLPVVDGGRPVGFVTLGDLAVDLDGRSALADISKAPATL